MDGGWLVTTLAMTVAGRELATVLPVFVVMIMRSGIALCLLSPVVFLWYRGDPVRTRRLPLHLARNLIHYAGQYRWFLSLTMIPIAQVVAIEFTMPIWTALLAAGFLGERLGAARIAAVALGLFGVRLIVRPGVEHFNPGQADRARRRDRLRSLDHHHQVAHPHRKRVTIIFWMFFVQSVIGLVPPSRMVLAADRRWWPWVAVVALCGTFSHFCMAQALSLADATVVVPMDFLRVPLSALAGWLVYKEGVNLWLALGSTLILAGNAVNLWRAAASQRRQARSRAAP